MPQLQRMEFEKFFYFWVVLSAAEKTTVFAANASLTNCTVPSVTTGERATITCHFNIDLKQENRNFIVQHKDQLGGFSEILSCYWLTRHSPTCETKPGYEFDGQLGRTVTLGIPSAGQQHVGTYMCLMIPSDLTDSLPCNFTLKGTHFSEVTKQISSTHPTINSLSTTQLQQTSNNTTYNEEKGNNLNVVVIVIAVVLVLLVCAFVAFIICRHRSRARKYPIGKACHRETDLKPEEKYHVESQPLVPLTKIRSPCTTQTPDQPVAEVEISDASKPLSVTENTEICPQLGSSQDETNSVVSPDMQEKERKDLNENYLCNRALWLIEKKGAVVITGPKRCGKSKLGRAVVDHFVGKGYTRLELDHPNQWWGKKQSDRKYIVLLDECKMNEWSTKSVKSMLDDNQCHIVFVVRSDVINSKDEKCHSPSVLKTLPTVDLAQKEDADAGRLLQACLKDDVEKVITILSGGFDPKWADRADKTPLHIACEHGQAEIVFNLLLAGSHVNVWDKHGRTPLHYACICSETPRSVHGSNTTQATTTTSNAKQERNGSEQSSQLDANNDNGDQCQASHESSCETVVKSLLAAGANQKVVDKQKKTALHLACEYDNYSLVKHLLAAGASVTETDEKGRTPLHVAAKYGDRYIVTMLILATSDVDARDKTAWTPLHVACEKGAKVSVELLLQAKADVNARTTGGRTPLHVACLKGNTEIVRMLRDAGADIHAKDRSGDTPKRLAKGYSYRDTVNTLS